MFDQVTPNPLPDDAAPASDEAERTKRQRQMRRLIHPLTSPAVNEHAIQRVLIDRVRHLHPQHVDAYDLCRGQELLKQCEMAGRLGCSESTLSERLKRVEETVLKLAESPSVTTCLRLLGSATDGLTRHGMQLETLSAVELTAPALVASQRFCTALGVSLDAALSAAKPTKELKKHFTEETRDDKVVVLELKPELRQGAAANHYGDYDLAERHYAYAEHVIGKLSKDGFLIAERATSLVQANRAYLALSRWLVGSPSAGASLDQADVYATASLKTGLVVPTAVLNAVLVRFAVYQKEGQRLEDEIARCITTSIGRGVSVAGMRHLVSRDLDIASPAFAGLKPIIDRVLQSINQ